MGPLPRRAARVIRNALAWRDTIRLVEDSYPWRNTRSPYPILVAEMLLRKTTAGQVVGVFDELMLRYPTPEKLAEARVGTLATLLRDLGLSGKRSVALKQVGKLLAERHGGVVPSDKTVLESLPHVGDYTASCVRVFGHGLTDVLLDSNTIRLYCRLLGLQRPRDPRRCPEIRSLSLAMARAAGNPARFNLAMLDLGRTTCTARKPACNLCPLRRDCHEVHQRARARRSTTRSS
ncbi:MAG: A/G-specific adenine glycosylase [Deltaproteobacteria bacterium]|nr:A/G-specific adenine glycosylase [Deltaproteobacteria bacterium]